MFVTGRARRWDPDAGHKTAGSIAELLIKDNNTETERQASPADESTNKLRSGLQYKLNRRGQWREAKVTGTRALSHVLIFTLCKWQTGNAAPTPTLVAKHVTSMSSPWDQLQSTTIGAAADKVRSSALNRRRTGVLISSPICLSCRATHTPPRQTTIICMNSHMCGCSPRWRRLPK